MKLISTKGQSTAAFREGVLAGLASDGGLYWFPQINTLPKSFFSALPSLAIQEIGLEVLCTLLGLGSNDSYDPESNLSRSSARKVVEKALTFDAPLHFLNEQLGVLELFHGPTLAFKDFGASFMAALFGHYLESSDRSYTILVATSGDTGGAVARAFLGVPGISVVILYPQGKVSEIQEKQLTTLGDNVSALEVRGNFDDCQKLVKEAFTDPLLLQQCNLTSANSINIARLIPQSFYYFRGWAQVAAKAINEGRLLSDLPLCTVSVPSGNFGNLTAGVLAQKMGLPIKHFVAATNENDIVPQYLATGDFCPKPAVPTLSNAMDVGNPSNFPRLLALARGSRDKLRELLSGYAVDDTTTLSTISTVLKEYNYLLDPHGAVGFKALTEELNLLPENVRPSYFGMVLETAHPAKFLETVAPLSDQEVIIPDRLAWYLQRQKNALVIGSDFLELKDYLLSRGD